MTPDLRYPVGPFVPPAAALTPAERREAVAAIAATPARLRAAVAGLDDRQLDTPYRDGGWTVRQVVHHVADSHMHAYARTRFLLTEDRPAIKAYDEATWAELPDARTMPAELSLSLLDALHARWAALMEALPDGAYGRALVHPERGEMTLDHVAAMYAWHGRHHVAHVTGLRERMGW